MKKLAELEKVGKRFDQELRKSENLMVNRPIKDPNLFSIWGKAEHKSNEIPHQLE